MLRAASYEASAIKGRWLRGKFWKFMVTIAMRADEHIGVVCNRTVKSGSCLPQFFANSEEQRHNPATKMAVCRVVLHDQETVELFTCSTKGNF